MKRLICIALAALLCLGAALAEGGMLTFTTEDTERKLEQMIPILDSLAVSLNVASDDAAFRVAYDPEDSQLIWNQLWQLSADWLSHEEEYQAVDGLKIPAVLMEACAKAAFGSRQNPLPAIPNSTAGSAVVYDPASDAYRVQADAGDGHALVIENYAADGAALVVNCGIYDQAQQRQGGMTARLEPAQADALYPYAVTEAHAETEGDFNGLWATRCSIRWTQPEATATPLPTATILPAPTAYRALTSGSRGEDVRAMQSRLNELGYNCGSADGVYGGGTRRAVRYFQDALGYSDQNGEADLELQRRLFAANAPVYERYVTLRRGSKGIRVESLQDRLRELGYTGAPSDGSYGERCQKAVTLFQRQAKLSADGVAGPATLKALERSNAPHCSRFIDLQKGDSGYRVKEMQNRLRELGFLDHHASGRYDSNTVEAVEAFKEAYDLHGNGRSASADVISMMFEDLDPIDEDDIIDIIDIIGGDIDEDIDEDEDIPVEIDDGDDKDDKDEDIPAEPDDEHDADEDTDDDADEDTDDDDEVIIEEPVEEEQPEPEDDVEESDGEDGDF